MNRIHFSSVHMDWRTPLAVYLELNKEFGFTLDAAANDANALHTNYFTERDDSLMQSWAGERIFVNPPYGRALPRWMEKIWLETAQAEVIVALVPSRTDTRWWHNYAMLADEIRFLQGRLRFEGHGGNSAPFPSCILVFQPNSEEQG